MYKKQPSSPEALVKMVTVDNATVQAVLPPSSSLTLQTPCGAIRVEILQHREASDEKQLKLLARDL